MWRAGRVVENSAAVSYVQLPIASFVINILSKLRKGVPQNPTHLSYC